MKKVVSVLLATAMGAALVLGGCAKSGDNADNNTSSADGNATQSASQPESNAETVGQKHAAVFAVTGQLGDKSFNDSAARGVGMLRDNLGWDVKIIEVGRDQTKWDPTFMDLSESGDYDLIITNGSNAKENIENVSQEFPDQKYLLFDTEIDKDKYPNVYAISYKQNEGSFVAGALAALVTTSSMENTNEEKLIGFIGGDKHPIISDFLVGYIEGAQSIDKDVKVIVSYIGSWDDTALGKEVAIAQFNQGVDITFPAAEQAGLGCVEAAVGMNKYIIGVDSDQAMLFNGVDENKANVILTSVLKNVDKSILRAGELYDAGTLSFGIFESLGIKEDGAGIAYNEYYEKNVPQEIRDKVEEARNLVVGGKVTVSTALGVDEAEVQKIIDSAK